MNQMATLIATQRVLFFGSDNARNISRCLPCAVSVNNLNLLEFHANALAIAIIAFASLHLVGISAFGSLLAGSDDDDDDDIPQQFL